MGCIIETLEGKSVNESINESINENCERVGGREVSEMVLVVMNNGDLYHISESVWQQACQAKQEWLNFRDIKTGRRVSIQLMNVSVVRYES